MKSALVFARRSVKKLLACLLFISCWNCPAHAQTVCADSSPNSVPINNTPYIIMTNEWNNSAKECLSINDTNFNVSDSLITPQTNLDHDSSHPGAYPAIYQGCHWNNCSDSSLSRQAILLSTLSSATSSWSTITSGSSADVYDIAYDIWFNKDPVVPSTPPQSGRPNGAELMIWLYKQGPIGPNGNLAGQFSTSGITFQVYYNPNASPPVVSYVIPQNVLPPFSPVSVSNLDIKSIIDDAIAHYGIQSSWYLIDVEAGFEIWNGGKGLASSSFSFNPTTNSTGTLNIWWPTEGSVLSGTQPFKARLENVALSSYNMYWAVDSGQLNLMSDNTAGGDHKEASVDLSGWTWRDAGDKWGPFSVNFIAKDLSGTVLQQKAVNIYVAKSLSIWWPTDGSVLSGTQPFKARLDNVSLSSYNMYWSVDGGQLNFMGDNTVGGDHKEASVDLTGWTWRDNGSNYGPFSVTFTAKDLSGATVKTKSITIYRAK